eukprot:TRINITY_DN22748_c0_g1_i1.p1 TRINITY_DN22748_c0_g1~~TRINITY_DN22748_c0_g1_i1.p1  ORF type:complete len:246 (-),score=66.38 TRINITY_DN22748_c0_g1_i1:23-760(-)
MSSEYKKLLQEVGRQEQGHRLREFERKKFEQICNYKTEKLNQLKKNLLEIEKENKCLETCIEERQTAIETSSSQLKDLRTIDVRKSSEIEMVKAKCEERLSFESKCIGNFEHLSSEFKNRFSELTEHLNELETPVNHMKNQIFEIMNELKDTWIESDEEETSEKTETKAIDWNDHDLVQKVYENLMIALERYNQFNAVNESMEQVATILSECEECNSKYSTVKDDIETKINQIYDNGNAEEDPED